MRDDDSFQDSEFVDATRFNLEDDKANKVTYGVVVARHATNIASIVYIVVVLIVVVIHISHGFLF